MFLRPNTLEVQPILENATCSPAVLSAVSSNEEMDTLVDKSYYESDSALPVFYVGLYFYDMDGDEPPRNLSYDLRLPGYWFTELIYPFIQIPGPRNFSKHLDARIFLITLCT